MYRAKVKFYGSSQMDVVGVTPMSNKIEWNGNQYDFGNLAFDVPLSGTVYGTLLNYKGALAMLGGAVYEEPYKAPPMAPMLYIKPVNTLIGYGQPIPLPSDVVELEIGASLGVVMGCTATRVNEDRVLDYVSGYTVVNDVSIPHASLFRPAIREKARDGFCPVGPWIIDKSAVVNPDALTIRVFINGELRQENTTANLIRSVPRLISDITEFMTLYAGDTVLVGIPEDAPRVKAKDFVRIEIENVGRLENQVVQTVHGSTGGLS